MTFTTYQVTVASGANKVISKSYTVQQNDPDPLLNHGIDEGDNALFAIRLIELLGGDDAVIAFDDGPGAPRTPASFWIAMFEPPLIAITIAIAALFAGLGLIAIARFGSRAGRPR